MTDNTRDLTQFGYRELRLAGELLLALKTVNDKTEFLGDGVAIEFNPNSGNVFLVDEDYNVAMMNGHNLEDWFVTPYNGIEGFAETLRDEYPDMCEEDQEYCREVGIINTQAA